MTTTPYLLVRVGERVAALPALAVRRVVRGARLHPLPGAGPGLVGLAEFAGEPLAVLDLAQLLGEERRSSRPPVTVVTWLGSGSDRELVGLGVDDAIEVTEIDAAALGVGQALVGGRPVLVVDLDRLGVEA
ncbi:MAG: chemotaxis protein CheW [Thermoanaerobaculia bacterium]|nr:chemotaxis protein CheW [Thermoanaerobaculia bacterium]